MAHWLRDRGFDAYAVTRRRARPARARRSRRLPVADDRRRDWKAGAAALRHRRFQIYFGGVLLSLAGSWVEAGAFGYVVLLLGGSAATLGIIGFLNTIPNLVFALPAGVLADHFDRRKILLLFQGGNMGVAIALAVLWATGDADGLPHGRRSPFIGGTLGTLSFPAFQSHARLDGPGGGPRERGRAEQPLAPGRALRRAGDRRCAACLGGPDLGLRRERGQLPRRCSGRWSRSCRVARARSPRRASASAGAMADGLRYVFGQRSLASLMILMVFAGMFATPPVAFMVPGLVRFQLHEGPETLGLLISLIGLGSVLGSIALLLLARRPNKGEPRLVCYLLCAAAIAVIGVSTSVPLSFALALIGGFTRRRLHRPLDGRRPGGELGRDALARHGDLGRRLRRRAPDRRAHHGRARGLARRRRRGRRGRGRHASRRARRACCGGRRCAGSAAPRCRRHAWRRPTLRHSRSWRRWRTRPRGWPG